MDDHEKGKKGGKAVREKVNRTDATPPKIIAEAIGMTEIAAVGHAKTVAYGPRTRRESRDASLNQSTTHSQTFPAIS